MNRLMIDRHHHVTHAQSRVGRRATHVCDHDTGSVTINRELIAKAEATDSRQRVVLDIDSTEIPVYGNQEQSAYNGHFESTCFHPLLQFNREGDCFCRWGKSWRRRKAWSQSRRLAVYYKEFGSQNGNSG